MKRSVIYLLTGTVALVVLGGCQRISEPWDSSEYFSEYRDRPTAVQKQLRDRLAHTQNEYERPSHQTE